MRRAATAEPPVTYDLVGDVAVVVLNDPDRLNALSTPMIEALSQALARAEREARAIVLTGAGRAFCAGASLVGGPSATPRAARDMGERLESHFNPLMLQMRDLSTPLVTAVNGAAAGIGCAIALMGDLIVAEESAYFLQAFARIGLAPDGGSAFILAAAVGRPRALEMMMLGEKLPAATALDWGLINRLAPEGQARETAMQLAGRLAAGPTTALALTRKLTWAALEQSFTAQLALERAAQMQAGRTDHFEEGLAAFREKRSPRFTDSL